MQNKKYKLVSLYQYLDMLEPKVLFKNQEVEEIKDTIKKMLSSSRRAAANAIRLEKLLT